MLLVLKTDDFSGNLLILSKKRRNNDNNDLLKVCMYSRVYLLIKIKMHPKNILHTPQNDNVHEKQGRRNDFILG